MKYVVKWGDLYADGSRNWRKSQKKAFRFSAKTIFHQSAKDWAKAHANTFTDARVVKLVPKRAK